MSFLSRKGCGRTLLLTAAVVAITAGGAVGQTDITSKFKDANFRAEVYSRIGKTAPAPILDSDVRGITDLNVSYKSISDLSGIEEFIALTELNCHYNQLTALDVSKNTALKGLACGENRLTALDVSKNTALTSLYCFSNQLTALDVSKNTALTNLSCANNQLTALDVSKNTALTRLDCFGNHLTALDVSKNTALWFLYCEGNQLTTLDVSKNTALTVLNCYYNQLTALDVSNNTALTWLYCSNNRLTALDVSKNTALTRLTCTENQLTALDVSKNTALTDLSCSDNQLTALDVSKNTALTHLRIEYNLFAKEDDIIGLNKSNLTFFKFSPQWRLVTFNSQGGSVVNSQMVSLKIVKPTDPTRSGYIFGGWYGDAACAGNAWNFNTDIFNIFNIDITPNITLYAKWIPIFTVTFNATGGTVTSASDMTRADSTLATLPTPTRSGNYIFDGWFTSETGGEKITTSKKYSANTTIYAKWIPVFTVTFNANGGTVTPASGTTRADSTLASLPTPTRGNDYAFDGWFTAETNGEKVTASKVYSANTTIYARWTQSLFTVTLAPNGGVVTPVSVKTGESGCIVSLPTPTKEGYTFSEWFTAETGGEPVTESTVFTANDTIHARWTYNAVTEVAGVPNNIKINEQYPLTATVVPANAASKTIVWSVENAGTTRAGVYDGVFFAMSEGPVVLKATIADGKAVGVPYEQFFFINAVVSVASPDRVIPAVRPGEESAVVAPVNPLTAEFTAGPNPASRSSGKVNFFRTGSRVSYATLSIYDASGNVVKKIRVIDDAVGSQLRRKVSTWNLRDSKGRPVPVGTYLVKGVVKTSGGNKERVSLVVGVR